MSIAEATTNGICVEVDAAYSREHSAPEQGRWFFLYTVRIRNGSEETVQLLSRHWVITDATGKVEEVRGPGVVGEQPVLEPGASFEYTSGCPLATPFGHMRGRYEMRGAGGARFHAEIPRFDLREPRALH
jgi:ApaG protein